MSNPLATYTFLPWVRQGLSNAITQSESTANPALRASVPLQLSLRAQGISAAIPDTSFGPAAIALYGPGDLVAIEERAIVKTEPRHWLTNFEPNNLAHIEFYDEDFPWRYTPASADVATGRHRPWIALVVLAEGEFTEGVGDAPSHFVHVADLRRLPVKEELWAWAHVHANRNLGANDTTIVSTVGVDIAAKLEGIVSENSDLACSRIICPRKLEPDTAYHAFLIPTFETGRVAGLGLDVSQVDDAMRGAWEDHAHRAALAGDSFPYYYRWFFRTGKEGDFESLVRLLKPRQLDARVGRRDIDVQMPGANLSGVPGPNVDGVLRLGGALRVPDLALSPEQLADARRFEKWDHPRPAFQEDLASFINLADDYAVKSATDAHDAPAVPAALVTLPDGTTDPDPLITAPLYGTWHALTKRLLRDRHGNPLSRTRNWVHELNLDPRHRSAAGFGTRVVRERQEEYVDAAWKQIGEVLEANRKLRLAQFSVFVAGSIYRRLLGTPGDSTPSVSLLTSEQAPGLLNLTAPVASRIVMDGITVRKRRLDSRVPPAVTAATMRRALRPRGRLMRALPDATAAEVRAGGVLTGLDADRLRIAEPPTLPPGAPSVTALASSLLPAVPPFLVDWLRRYPALLRWLLLLGLVLVVLLLVLGLAALALLVAIATLVTFAWLRRQATAIAVAEAVLPGRDGPDVVPALPHDPSFTLEPYGVTLPQAASGTSDTPDAVRFKQALDALLEIHREAAPLLATAPRDALDLPATVATVTRLLDPQRSVPLRFGKQVRIPDRIRDGLRESFVEAMAYPRIDEPMYRPLADIASELLLPNIGLIPPDSICLLETNQSFIESYMVGLNHEFARELLWREYPTDQRGSTFRQFWDVSGYLDRQNLAPDALREKLYDVPKLHLWSSSSELGDHDNRQPPGSPPKQEAVLSVRGELLKRYPTAVIYAHRAAWQTAADGSIDKSLIRIPMPLGPAEEANPPRDKVKTPLYQARVDPDITFFGFDLTVNEARGNPDTDDAGWFFVIKERPGEPVFGLDIDRGGAPINSWSDLAWDDVTVDNGMIRIDAAMNECELTTAPPASEGPNELAQHLEDKQVKWSRNANAADVAYVLYQLPVLIAVHAGEMLPRS